MDILNHTFFIGRLPENGVLENTFLLLDTIHQNTISAFNSVTHYAIDE
ncbi:hypothetical protein [Stenoxybacter acetivorans]|nr:hypothetical protein [Stenoxybacter acetivorans]